MISFTISQAAIATVTPSKQLIVGSDNQVMILAARYQFQRFFNKLWNQLRLFYLILTSISQAALVIFLITPCVEMAFVSHCHAMILAASDILDYQLTIGKVSDRLRFKLVSLSTNLVTLTSLTSKCTTPCEYLTVCTKCHSMKEATNYLLNFYMRKQLNNRKFILQIKFCFSLQTQLLM